jgi:hypothetical protein
LKPYYNKTRLQKNFDIKSSINYIQYFGTKNFQSIICFRSEEEIQELRDRLEASENHILDLVGFLDFYIKITQQIYNNKTTRELHLRNSSLVVIDDECTMAYFWIHWHFTYLQLLRSVA